MAKRVPPVSPVSHRFVVGIDLGTTNCALGWVDTAAGDAARVRIQDVPQLVNAGEVAARTLLPSFLYAPGELDFPAGSLALPWDEQPRFVTGELARRRGAENPVRLIASAKSWLSHGAANRTAPILPWGAPDEVPHISPVDASAEYLKHLAAVFDRDVAQGDAALALAHQDVLLTVPASFDEEARELTLRAARTAGLEQVTLLEEPQAAFYAWLDALGDGWRRRVNVGDLVLVCDVGGGTTDFSLIAVGERDGDLTLERVAVGEHILLGGDNMDLALARLLQQRLEAAGHRIDTWQLHGLWHQARLGKESLLGDATHKEHPVTLLGRGSRLIGGTITTTLTAADVDGTLLEGFFPQVGSDAMPARQRRVGLQEIGLPYAADPAVTRHLARFLRMQATAASASAPIRRGRSGLACPTHVLFNGGVMKAEALRTRVVDVLSAWLAEEGFEALDGRHVLDAPDLDHAVAQGAAYYGMARRGRGVRIRSGAAAQLLRRHRKRDAGDSRPGGAVESVVCGAFRHGGRHQRLAARSRVRTGRRRAGRVQVPELAGPEDGSPRHADRRLGRRPRGDEPAGSDAATMAGKDDMTVPVSLESRVTEVGTLELWCVARGGTERWKLELNIREREP